MGLDYQLGCGIITKDTKALTNEERYALWKLRLQTLKNKKLYK